MSNPEHISGPRSVVRRRVGRAVQILRIGSCLDDEVLLELTAAFDDALAGGASDIVVELGGEPVATDELVGVLRGMAEAMLARDGKLWLAAPWADGTGHTLRPLREDDPEAMRGVTAGLDDVLDRASRRTSDS